MLTYISEYGISAQSNFKISLIIEQVIKGITLAFDASRLSLNGE